MDRYVRSMEKGGSISDKDVVAVWGSVTALAVCHESRSTQPLSILCASLSIL